MATTHLSLNGRTEAFDDVDLLLVMRLILNEADDNGRQGRPDFSKAWEEAIDMRAPGMIPIDLEMANSTANSRAVFARIIERTSRHLDEWCDSIPLSYLQKHCLIPGVQFSLDYPTARLRETLVCLRRLVMNIT